MLQFITFGALMAALIYLAVLYSSSPLVMLAFAGILLMGAAYLYLAAMCFFVRCSLEIPISMTEQNQSVDIEAVIENRSFLPVLKIKIWVSYQLPLAGKHGKIKMTGMADAAGRTLIQCRLLPEECGGYRISLTKLKIYDLTGFFCLTKYQKKKEKQLYVMPQMREFEVSVTEASRNFLGEENMYDDTIGGDDISETFQIRPFRDGDKLQSIHWKISAKTDNLMVRENKLPQGCPVVLFLETGGKRKVRKDFYGVALSLSYSLILVHCPHFVVWYSSREKDIIRVRVEEEEGLYLFLLMLYEEPVSMKEWDIKALYREKYRTDVWMTDICIDKESIVKINDHKIDKLEEVELVV